MTAGIVKVPISPSEWRSGPSLASETVLSVGADHPCMETEGVFDPETEAAARERFESLATPAETVVKESARQMAFDSAEFDERITEDVLRTAQESLFASLLVVHVGVREEFEEWQASHDYDVTEVGHEQVDNVVWHALQFADEAVAATFQNQREAAVGTLRRQAFGRLYREVLE